MGSWFTDYIFYPISVCKPMLKLSKFSRSHFGEVIGKRVPVYLSSFVVWFATGIWHGASWNFIAWGLGNWLVIMVSQELEPLYQKFHARFQVKERFGFRLFQVVRTVLMMSCLRLFDCYRDVPLTFRMFGSMFSVENWDVLWNGSLLNIGLTVKKYGRTIAAFLIVISSLLLLQRLLMPKYADGVIEGALISEYYDEDKEHDVIFIGDCEVYENFSPAVLWQEYGIHSYIRGSAQQLIWQSYYLLEDTLRYETPKVVVFNVLTMKYNEPQKEAYN